MEICRALGMSEPGAEDRDGDSLVKVVNFDFFFVESIHKIFQELFLTLPYYLKLGVRFWLLVHANGSADEELT